MKNLSNYELSETTYLLSRITALIEKDFAHIKDLPLVQELGIKTQKEYEKVCAELDKRDL